MSIKLYKASSFNYTPFEGFVKGDLEYLTDNGIKFVTNINDADIIISQNYKHIKRFFWRGLFGKKFLIWTLEPKFDTHTSPKIRVFFNLFECHIMNVYTQDVFVTNLSFHSGLITKKIKLVPKNFKFKNKRIVALMSYYKGIYEPNVVNQNFNADLIALRSKIALEGNKLGVVDVYGKGWPEGVSKENSREGDWVNRKKQLINNYHFNLCFENTSAFNYMTEKIWDSIENYCLPIYYSKNTNAYSLFPKNSFIDYSEYNSPEELFNFISKMKDDEFVKRMNTCIAVYNEISSKGKDFVQKERQLMLDKIIDKVNYLIA
jgi:hypothetical protein